MIVPYSLPNMIPSFSWAMISILAIYIIFFCVGIGKAAVEMESFSPTPENSSIILDRKTLPELNNTSLWVAWRIGGMGEYFEGNSSNAAKKDECNEYLYYSDEVEIGKTIKLELVDCGLEQSIGYNSPISAAVQITTTATWTQTTTHTKTPTTTNSPTPSTIEPSLTASKTLTREPSKTLTNTQSPTRTAFPTAVIPTTTPTQSWTLSPSQTITFTATLTPTSTFESVPTIVYTLKPMDTRTPTGTPSPTIMTIPSITPGGFDQYLNNLVESGEVVQISWIVIVVALWGIVALGIYIYINNR